HYYIHAVEASDRPGRAEPYADRLRGAVPGAGHLVHMPSHIYYRVGRYLDALADNTTAAAVDEKYLAASDAPMGVYRLGYYPHNVHFVMASALMAGEGANSIAAAEKLHGLVPDAAALAIPGTHPVKAAPYYAHALFSSPDAILALPDPGNSIRYVKAMWHYARGVAYAARRDFVAGKAEANAIDTLERTADFSPLKTAGIPASEVLQLARTVVEGRLAQADSDSNKAIERFEQAATLQDALPYTEPPYWYYPVRQSLAVALMQAGRLEAAGQKFRLAVGPAPDTWRSRTRRTMAGRITGSCSSTRRATTRPPRERRKPSLPRPGSAIGPCWILRSCEGRLPSRLAWAHHGVLQPGDREIHRGRNDGQNGDSGHHDIHLENLAAVLNEIAKTKIGRLELANDHAHERQAGIYLERSHERRHAPGQHDFSQDLPLGR